MSCDEGGGLPQASRWRDDAGLSGGPGHGAGAGGDLQALGNALAAAPPQPVPAQIAQALPLTDPAHQALRHHLVKALPVLPRDEDPGEHHTTTRGRQRRRGKRIPLNSAVLGWEVREGKGAGLSGQTKIFLQRVQFFFKSEYECRSWLKGGWCPRKHLKHHRRQLACSGTKVQNKQL